MKIKVVATWKTESGAGFSREVVDVEAPQCEDAEAIVVGQINAEATASGDPVAMISVRSYEEARPLTAMPDRPWSCGSGKPGCQSSFSAPRKNRVPPGWAFVGGVPVCSGCVSAYRQARKDALQDSVNAKLPWNQP